MPPEPGSRPGQPTVRDVARLAGVSQSTVSRVLNHVKSPIAVREETRQRILAAAEDLGYQPNVYASSLRGQKTRMIAMMIADITNSFYHPMVRAVQDMARQHKYDVMIANSDHLRENEELFCQAILRRPVDGIIAVPWHVTGDELAELTRRTGAAIACLGQHIEHPDIDVVYARDDEATCEAVCWLIERKGYRKIAYIGVDMAFAAGARRYQGYCRAMTEAGLDMPPEYLQRGDWSIDSGAAAMAALLNLPVPPTAVVACNDNMALGAILTAQEMGRRVPEDIAVVGFDNIPAGSWIRPRLTTIAQYPAEIGQQLAKAVFDRIEGGYRGAARRVETPCRLIERESA
jgi:LacI family transcriptional regulator